MTLTQLEGGKRGPALMNRLVGDASIYKKHLDRKPLPSEDGVKYFMETVRPHFTRRFFLGFFSGDVSIYFAQGKKHGDGQLDRKDVIAPQAFEGFLDGHVTNDRQVPASQK